jgi:hypothetical protein
MADYPNPPHEVGAAAMLVLNLVRPDLYDLAANTVVDPTFHGDRLNVFYQWLNLATQEQPEAA